MAKININASPDEIQQAVSSIAPPQIPSVPLPPPPPMPVPAAAGYKAFASDPLNQSAISKHITPPNTPILPPAPIPAAPPAPSSTILPPGMTPPSQMASVNPPKPQMASANPPQIAPATPPSLYGGQPPMTESQYFAANPGQQARKQFSGGGLVQNILNGLAAGTLGAAGGLKGNPGLGAEWVQQGAARDAQVPEVNNQRYRAAVVQPQLDAIKAQEAAATVAHTQAQTGDIGAKRQQEYAKLGLKETANPDGTTALAVDPDSPVTKANADKDTKLQTQTQLLSAQIESTKAQKELRDAQTAFNQAKTDPNSPLFKQTSQRLAIAQQNANAAGQRAQAYWGNYLQHSQNLGLDMKPLAGAPIITDDNDNPSIVGSTNAPLAVKQQKGIGSFNDLVGSVSHARSALKDFYSQGGSLSDPAIVAAMSDPTSTLGKVVNGKLVKGNLNDLQIKGINAVRQLHEQAGILRSTTGGTASEAGAQRILDTIPSAGDANAEALSKLDEQDKVLSRLAAGQTKVTGGISVKKPNNMVPPSQGMMFARDPQGKLHQAPAGTALPPGWKAGK